MKDLLYGTKKTLKKLSSYTCLFSSTEKEASYLQKCWCVSIFSFSSSIPSEKSQKILLSSRKIVFAKENFRAAVWNLAEFYCGNKVNNRDRAVSLRFARSGSQSQPRIWFILRRLTYRVTWSGNV